MGNVKVYGNLFENETVPVDSGNVANIYADFVQNTPAATWIINHNSGRYRTLAAFTLGGVEMEGDVIITSNNQTTIQFLTPIAGFAVFTN